jgi:uncharacterized coiled-coil protein SlyX
VDAQVAVQIQVLLVVAQAVVAQVAVVHRVQVQVAHLVADQVLQRNLHYQDQPVVVHQVVAL